MKKEEYPDKIYANAIITNTKTNECYVGYWGTWKDATYYGEPIKTIEYTRSDIIPKWHKYPGHKPENDSCVTVAVLINGEIKHDTCLYKDGQFISLTKKKIREDVIAYFDVPDYKQ